MRFICATFVWVACDVSLCVILFPIVAVKKKIHDKNIQ